MANFGCFGAFTGQREPIWVVDPDRHVRTHPGIADVDGDGTLELGTPFGAEFRCYQAATGTLEWSLTLPGGSWSDVVTADINGDARPEFLFAQGSTFYAIGSAGKNGNVLWSKRFADHLHGPIVADVTGSDALEILVITSAGQLYVLSP